MSLFQTKARASKEFPPPKDAGLQAIANQTAELARLAAAPAKRVAIGIALFLVFCATPLYDLGFFLIPFFLFALIGLAFSITRRFALGEEAIIAIEDRGKPDGVPYLIETLLCDAATSKVQKRAFRDLEALLLLAQSEGCGDILPRHIAWLNRTLGSATSSASAELRIAIVRALKHIGDAESLRILEAIVSRAAVLRTDSDLVESATESLPEIKARLAKAQEQESLLRASAAPKDDNELLRPSKGGATEPPHELLRPKDR